MAEAAAATQGGQSSSQGGSQQTSGTNQAQGNGSQANQAGQTAQTTNQQTSQQTSQQTQAGSQTGTQQTAVTRPEYVPENFWDGTKNEVKGKEFGEHFAALQARVAADDVRRNSLPANPDAYKVELPKDFQPPQGVEFKFNDGDPLLAQARTVMHEIDTGKLSGQEAFTKLLGLYAGAQVATQTQITAARNAEMAKLGPAGTALVTATNTWLDAMGVPGLKGRMFTAQDVNDFAKLVGKFTNQGGASFTSRGREPPEPAGKVSDEAFKKMGPAERLDYARKFPQDQFQKNGTGRAA